MKGVLIALATASTLAFAAGCKQASDDDTAVKPGSGVAQNPSGKPKDATQAAYANQMQKTGDAMNAQREKDAAAYAAARSRAGGK